MATISRYTVDASPDSLLSGKVVLSGAKQIVFTPFNQAGTAPGSDSYFLESIIADTLSITQDDPETNSIECETSDTAIKTTVVEGSYNIEMTCADIQKDILEKLLGFGTSTSVAPAGGTGTLNVAYAPESHSDRYCAIEIVFDDAILVCPKVNITSKIDISSVKTETCKATISGTMELYNIGTAGSPIKTPFFVIYPNS